MKLVVKLKELIKTGFGQRQLVSKEIAGNRAIYHYLQPDGSMKTVTKRIDPKKIRPPKEDEKSTQSRQAAQEKETGPGREAAQKAAPKEKNPKYMSLPEDRFVSFVFGKDTKSAIKKEIKSWSGIKLRWKIHVSSSKKELHVMTGEKFRLSVHLSEETEDSIKLGVRVENLDKNTFVYSKTLTVLNEQFESNIDTLLSQVSFIASKPELAEDIKKFSEEGSFNTLSEIEAYIKGEDYKDNTPIIATVEYALEKRYFAKSIKKYGNIQADSKDNTNWLQSVRDTDNKESKNDQGKE